MFATRVSKVLSVLLPHMIHTCVNITLRQAHKDRKVKRLYLQIFYKTTMEVHFKLTETIIKANYQITFSSTEMVLVTQ